MRMFANRNALGSRAGDKKLRKVLGFVTSVLLMTGLFQATDIATTSTPASAATTFALSQTITSDYINTSSKSWPVGVRACVTGLTNGQSYSSVSANFEWTTSAVGIDLIGSATQTVNAITYADPCVDIYYQIAITGTNPGTVQPGTPIQSINRKYTIAVNLSGATFASPATGTPSPSTHSATTPTNRQIWVSNVIDSSSQKVGDISMVGSAGGAVTLTIGETYTFNVPGDTGTNALAATVNAYFDPKIFQIISVSSVYTDKARAATQTSYNGNLRNACDYDFVVGSATYNTCKGSTNFDATFVLTYKVKVIGLGDQSSIPTSVTSLFSNDWKTFTKLTSTGITAIKTVWPLKLTVNGGTATASVTTTSSPAAVSGTQTTTGCTSYPCTVTANYNEGTVVTLTASVGANESFAGWGGACSGTALTCRVTVDAIQNVTASFGAIFPLSIKFAGAGFGTVTSDVGSISCSDNASGATSGTCSTTFNTSGQQVVLSAAAAQGQLFTGWAGGCATSTVATDKLTGTCTVTMNASKTIEATFVAKPVLTVKIGSNAAGPYDVTTDVGGISCSGVGSPTRNTTSGNCDAAYSIGDTVILTAATVVGSTRPIWVVSPASAKSSGCAVAAATCTLVINADTVVNVTYSGMPLSVSIDAAKTGTGSVSSSDNTINCGDGFAACSYLYGDSPLTTTLTATAKAGSTFGAWLVSSTGSVTQATNCAGNTGVCTLTWDAATTSVTVVADFNLSVTLTVSTSGVGSGTVTSASANINCGATCTKSYSVSPFATETLTATPAAGSYFIGWSSTACSGTSTCSLTVDDNISVIAQFGTAYTITVNAGAGGTITPGTSSVVPSGSTPTYTITPDPTYRVVSATLDGTTNIMSQLVTSGSDKTYTFSAVGANHTLAVTFSNKYTITVNAGANGSISPGTSSTITAGSTPLYTITPATGYHVSTVTVDGNNVSVTGAEAEKTYTFSAVNSDMTLAATFAIDVFNVVASAGANGTISPTGTTGVSWGGSVEYTFTPASGYRVASVVINGVSQSWTQNTYTFTNVQANKTIEVTFTPITYTVTVNLTGSGTSSTATGSVNYGATPEYTFTPASGFRIVAATVGGVDIMSSLVTVSGETKKYTFPAIYADKTIAITFSDKYAITVSAGANGGISPATDYNVVGGTTPAYVVTPSTGYHVASITVDGSAVDLTTGVTGAGKAKTYTFGSISGDHTISATFAIDTFDLVATTSANGTISPSGTTTVNYGSSQEYTFTAASGYRLATVTIDGTLQSPTPTSYTFSNVTAGHTIAVTFVAITYTLTATDATAVTSTSATIGGSLNPDGDTPGAVTICWGSLIDMSDCTSVNVKSQVTNLGASNTLSTNLTGLNPGSTYYFKIYTTDSSGVTGQSTQITFKMSVVATQDASSIGINGATLNGTFVAGTMAYATADITSLKLCYSATKTSDTVLGGTPTCTALWEASGTPSLAANATKTSAVTIAGLTANTTYHSQMQIVYANTKTQNGVVKSFTTLPNPDTAILSAVSISSNKATIRGTVNPKNNQLNKVTFCWKEGASLTLSECTAASGSHAKEDQDISIASWNGSGNSHQFDKALTSLKDSTTYTYMIYATSNNYVSASRVDPARVGVMRAARIGSTAPTTTYTPTVFSPVSYAAASGQISYSDTGQFTTAGTSTEAPTSVGSTAARMNGHLYTPTGGLAAGDVTSVELCYSTVSTVTSRAMTGGAGAAALNCGSNLWAGTTLAGGITQHYYTDLTGLASQQTYYYQTKVVFADTSVVYGNVLNFTTLAAVAAPTVSVADASLVTKTTATINGVVNANNSAVTAAEFCWGTSPTSVSCTVIPITITGWSTSANVTTSSALTGLTPGETYFWTIKATNGQGTTTSTEGTFTTKVGVTYNKDSASSNSTGTAPTDSTTYNVGDSITVLGNTTNLTLAGAYFAGWSLSNAGTGTAYGPTFNTTYAAPANNVTFYAIWTKYTINFLKGDGGGTAPGDLYGVNNLPGIGSMTAPTGKAFNGWDCGAAGTSFTPTANTTCTAQWVVVGTYSVTYSANGATGGMIPSDTNVYSAGATITVLGNTGSLTLAGHSFAGWYLAADTTTLYGPALTNKTYVAPSSNVTFLAKWVAYTVSFNRGTGGGTAPAAQDGVITMPGSTGMVAPANTTFGGWTCSPAGSPTGTIAAGTSFTPSATTTCTAVWTSTLTSFTIFYSATQSTGGTLPANTVGSGSVTLAQNTGGLFRNGYNFAGWIIQGTNYSAGATFNVTIDVTAEARWVPESSSGPAPTTYTITLFYVPGTTGPNTLTYTVGDPPMHLPIVARPGYEFQGWSAKEVTQTGIIDGYKPTKSENMWTVWKNLPATTKVYFNGDSPVLRATEKNSLKKLAEKMLKNVQRPQMIVYGWVKETTDKSYDQKLSYQRAVNTAAYLRKLGVDAIVEKTPKGISPENSAKSRRTDVRLYYSGPAVTKKK